MVRIRRRRDIEAEHIEDVHADPHPVDAHAPPDAHYVQEHVDEPLTHGGVESRQEVERAPFNPGAIVSLLIGLGFVILGGIVLAQAGFSDLLRHVEVAGLDHTPVLGFLEIAFGVLLLTAATPYGPQRGTMIFLGALALAGGIIIVAQPSGFHEVFGVHASSGYLFAFVGAILLLTGLAAPVVFGRDRSYRYHH